jgi:ABC-type multidrug transport system fused ATPase/permease subunit
MVSSSFFEMATVGLSVPLLDVLTNPAQSGQNQFLAVLPDVLGRFHVGTGSGQMVFFLLLLACVLFMVHSVFLFLSQYTTAVVSIRLHQKMKIALFERFLRAPFEEVSRRARGTIVHYLNESSHAVSSAIAALSTIFSGLANLVLMTGLLIYLSWWSTVLVALVTVGGLFGWRQLTSRRAAYFGQLIHKVCSEQAKLEVDAIDGVRIVKAYGLQQRILDRDGALLHAEEGPRRRITYFRVGPPLMHEGIASVVTVMLGAMACFIPSLGLRFAELVAFLLALRRMAPSVARVSTAIVDLNRLKPNLEVIEEVLERLPQERRGGKSVGQIECIELRNVTFSYQSRPNHQVLKDVNMVIPRGAVTAIVGPTGAGKSTVASLLVGLSEPSTGLMCVNGCELRELDLSDWRRRIGYVAQDIFIFNDTIRNNITFGEPIPLADLDQAVKVAQLDEFIHTLPRGYDMVVGDRGIRLSGGQCQRLALARALCRRPEVFIFDEATSALDSLTEQAFYSAISTLHYEAIVVVIAHRLSTIQHADQIIVLEAGRVVEQGTHDTLMNTRGGLYARLYQQVNRRGTPRLREFVSVES